MKRVLVGLLVVGCQPAASTGSNTGFPTPNYVKTGEVVATIGPVQLTTGELERRVRQLNPVVRARFADQQELRKFIENEIRGEILAQEAYRQGLFVEPDVQRALQQAAVSRLMQDKLREIESNIEVTDADIIQRFKQDKDEYQQPERVRVTALPILASTEQELAAARKRMDRIANDVRTRTKKGERYAFDEYARQLTAEAEIDRKQIDMGFKTREELTERFGEENARRLFDVATVGDILVGETKNEVLLFKKTGRREAVKRSLEQMRSRISSMIRADRKEDGIKQFLDEIVEEQGIVVDEDGFDRISKIILGDAEPGE